MRRACSSGLEKQKTLVTVFTCYIVPAGELMLVKANKNIYTDHMSYTLEKRIAATQETN